MKMMFDGGPVMWLILFASIIAMVIFLEKWFQFHREQINVGELINGLFILFNFRIQPFIYSFEYGFIVLRILCDVFFYNKLFLS